MSPEEHQIEHQRLHKELDTLIACYVASNRGIETMAGEYISHHGSIGDSIETLMHWNFEKTLAPSSAEWHEQKESRSATDFESDRQMIILALAHLALERPGWDEALRGIAGRYGAEAMFDEFKRTGAQ